MNAFFFGASDRPLFGVYEPPKGHDLRVGAVICNAVGPEYYQSHRACRALARRMSGSGAHVLRFDYLGTGDSGGEVHELRVADWLANVEQAIDELKDMTVLDSVAVVGLRAGASLAAAAAGRRDDVSRLVLWDPCTTVAGPMPETGADSFPQPFVEELFELGLSGDGGQESADTLVVVTEAEWATSATADGTGPYAASGYTVRRVPGPLPWMERGDFGGGGLPVAALDEIVAWITHTA